jgi:hypothetical protein
MTIIKEEIIGECHQEIFAMILVGTMTENGEKDLRRETERPEKRKGGNEEIFF